MRTRPEQDANLRPISITLRERSSASVRFARSHRGNEVDSTLRVPHFAFWPPPPHFKRAKADFCGLSAFFHRHFLQFACFQPFAPKKPRCRRHLIPMVRKTCPPWRHRDGGSKLYQPPSTQYAIRAIFRLSKNHGNRLKIRYAQTRPVFFRQLRDRQLPPPVRLDQRPPTPKSVACFPNLSSPAGEKIQHQR